MPVCRAPCSGTSARRVGSARRPSVQRWKPDAAIDRDSDLGADTLGQSRNVDVENRPLYRWQRASAEDFVADKTQAICFVVARGSASFQEGAIADPGERIALQAEPCLKIKLDPDADQSRMIMGPLLGHECTVMPVAARSEAPCSGTSVRRRSRSAHLGLLHYGKRDDQGCKASRWLEDSASDPR